MTAVASCVLWHIDSNEDGTSYLSIHMCWHAMTTREADRIYNRDASVKLLYGDHGEQSVERRTYNQFEHYSGSREVSGAFNHDLSGYH